MVKTTKKR